MKMPAKRIAEVVASGALLIGGAGCSTSTADDSTPSARDVSRDTRVDVSIIERAGGEGDAIVYDSPADMARDREIAVAGEVIGFADGFESLDHGSASEGYDIRDYSVVMEVKVTELYKASRDNLDVGESIYLSLSRGAEQVGLKDDGGPSTITPVEEFEKAIPPGSTVVVIAGAVTLPEGPTTDVIDANRGVPKGSVLYSGQHPQALTFTEDAQSSWEGMSLAGVRNELAENL